MSACLLVSKLHGVRNHVILVLILPESHIVTSTENSFNKYLLNDLMNEYRKTFIITAMFLTSICLQNSAFLLSTGALLVPDE